MKIKIFYIRLSKEHISSDEEQLNDFLKNKKIVNTFAELVKTGKVNFWSVLVAYSEKENLKKANEKPEKLSFPTDTKLTEVELNIYNALKQWRTDKAKTENISSFVIAYDTELITIAKVGIKDIEDFNNIKGFGEKKIAKYGEEIIALLSSLQ